MMYDIEQFYPFVMPFAPGCPEPVMDHDIRLAAIEFCQRTRLWRFVHKQDVDKGCCSITCTPPQAVIHEIEAVAYNDSPLQATRYFPEDHQPGTPRYFSQQMPDSIDISPPPNDEERRLTVILWLKPSIDADALPAFLHTHHAEAIGNGALARLMARPGAMYTNPEQAMYRQSLFDRACNHNFNANLRGQQRAPVRTRAQYL